MITIKSNTYNKTEKLAINYILTHTYNFFLKEFCKGGRGQRCKECEFKHLCYDITKIHFHGYSLAEEVENESK